jgi:hypothetical protein
MNEDEIIVICSENNHNSTVGVQVYCRKCQTKIWLSDSTIKSIRLNHPQIDIEKTPPITLCIKCGTERIDDDTVFVPITDEQMAEITAGLKNMKP